MAKRTAAKKSTAYIPCSILDECYHLWGAALNRTPAFHTCFSVKGKLDREIMESALSASLDTHNKFKCVLTEKAPSWRRWFQLVWEPQEFPISNVLEFSTAKDLGIELNQRPHCYRDIVYRNMMDVSKEPGIKVLVISEGEDHLLVFSFHHSVVDGRGAFDFIETFVAEYNARYSNRNIAGPKRSRFAYAGKPVWQQAVDVAKSFIYVLRNQYRILREPLMEVAPESRELDEERMMVVRKVEPEDLEGIVESAERRSVRFLDLLLAGTYFAVKKWNAKLGGRESGRISFFAPTDLGPGVEKKSMGNFVSGAAINLLTKENADKDAVLRNLTKECNLLLRYNDAFGLLTVFGLVPLRLRRWLLQRVLQGVRSEQKSRFPTLRFNNIGVLNVAGFGQAEESFLGDAQLKCFFYFPGVKNRVPSLVLLTCNRRMYVCLACLTSMFSYESGQEFLSLLVREWSEY